MKEMLLPMVIGALAGHVFAGTLSAADDKAGDNGKAFAPLQQQIDELKEGQERLLRELAEIKKLLHEKPVRAEFPTRPGPSNLISMSVRGERFRGSSNAPVAIIEYSDFECSYCARYVREIYPKIDAQYIRPGRVKYFFRDLPPPPDTNAFLKARAARCAGEQGRFWEMHDRLFAAQTEPTGQDMTVQAKTVGLDLTAFAACLSSGRYADNVRMSVAGAKRIGLYGTPAFVIGTLSADGDFVTSTNVLVGGESLEPIKSALDQLLSAPRQR